MLGALEKWIALQGGKLAKAKQMPVGELAALIGNKGKKFAGSTASMMKQKPGESAALAGLGALGGASMAGEGEPEPDGDEELLRAYGIR